VDVTLPVYVFKLGKTIDAGELYNLLKAMMVNPAEMGCEVNGPGTKIIAASPDINLDMFPEGFSFGNGVSVMGDIAWVVVTGPDEEALKAKLPEIRKALEAGV